MDEFDVAVIGAGQAGLATAYVAAGRRLRAVVLEAAPGPGGSWPRYYDSLTLFSPARFSALPGLALPGDPDRYPTRDEVVAYLSDYAAHLPAPIQYDRHVTAVTADSGGFTVQTETGPRVRARSVVAASGGFGTPHLPALPGLDIFTGTVLHSADYRRPQPFTGQRVVVVGGGNSAVQIGAELATVARVTIASRTPLRWQRQHLLGRDFHWWLIRSGLDSATWPTRLGPRVPVIDDGRYRAALATGNPDHRPMFTRLDGDTAYWSDQRAERIDTVILATGYCPHLDYLSGTGALDAAGRPRHHRGVSTVVPGLGFVGLERQRSFASATLRGVGTDAAYVLQRLGVPLRRSGTDQVR